MRRSPRPLSNRMALAVVMWLLLPVRAATPWPILPFSTSASPRITPTTLTWAMALGTARLMPAVGNRQEMQAPAGRVSSGAPHARWYGCGWMGHSAST